ncbi:MAG: extracellular solute-binding protein [Christensenellaceae bacterium]
MFETNGWKVPTTYDELAALCATINSAALPVEGGDLSATVKPFVFTGQNADYFDYTVYTWWAQLAGKDAIEEFLEYKDASAFATKGSDGSALDNTYSKLKTATDYWNRLMKKENYVEGSAGKSNHLAQQNFVNGYAAMMFNGDWLYNEILGYKANEVDMTNFELGIMNTPALPGATYTDISYVIGEDQYIVIPASSDRIDQAKQFIKYVISDDGVSTFFNKAHGQLAYKTSAALTTEDGFMKNLLDFRTAAPKTFTNFSDSLLYLSNIVDIWSIASLRPYNALIGGTNTLDQAFESIQTQTASNWETWKRKAGIA